MTSAEEIVKDWWDNHGLLSKSDLAGIIRQAREEVREECARRCTALAAVENDIVGYAAQCVREIRALDLK